MPPRARTPSPQVIGVGLFLIASLATVRADTPGADAFPDILVSENKSVLRYEADYPFWYPWTRKQSICTSFYVSSRMPTVQEVVITSSGLGTATFKEEASPTNGCPDSNRDEQSQLVLQTLVGTKRILMRVAANDLPDLGNAIDGKIIVASANQKPQEIPIKLENPSSQIRTAWLWVWGILIPGAITFGFGYLAAVLNNRFSTRRAEWQEFKKYQDVNYNKLEGFFTGPYAVSQENNREDDPAFSRAIRAALIKAELLAALPRSGRRKLEKQIRIHNRAKIKLRLAKLFPDWETEINKPIPPRRNAGADPEE